MAGRFFDEWTVGDRIAHDIRRTVTETDNQLFSKLLLAATPSSLSVQQTPRIPLPLRASPARRDASASTE